MVKPNWVRGSLPLQKNRLTRFVMLNDVHVPDNVPLNKIFDFIKQFKPDYVLLVGDIVNNDPFDRWRLALPGKAKEVPDPEPYFEECNDILFVPLRAAVPKAKFIYWIGNHEYWSTKARETTGVGGELFEVWNHVDGIDGWVKRFGFANCGRLHFCHGDIVKNLPKHHARKVVDMMRRDVRYGHFHDIQEASFNSPTDKRELFTARACGTLQNFNPDFMQNRPHDWQHAFTYGYVHPNGKFHDATVRIIGGQFIAAGEAFE